MNNKSFIISNNDKKAKIKYYENIAYEIRSNLSGKKRPLIIEFTGLPKAGKTTVINSLSLFLRRNDIPCFVVNERASVCPVPNKKIPEFNIWTGCTTLSNLIKCKYEKRHSVVILDRGILDSLIWMNLLLYQGKLTQEEFQIIENFYLLHRIIKDIDLIIYMYSTVDKSIQREYKDLLTTRPGQIMNEEFLSELLSVSKQCINKYQSYFEKIIEIDTTHTETIEGVEKVTSEAILSLKELSDEKLILIPQSEFKKRLSIVGFNNERNQFKILERIINSHSEIQRRSIAENDTKKLQLIVCTVITFNNQIALFTKHEIRSDKRFHNKNMVWIGGHVHNSDIDDSSKVTLQKTVTNCLIREIEEEIQLPVNINPVFKGLVYDNTSSRSLQHLGIVFEIELRNINTYKAINLKTFTELSGQSITIEFVPLEKEYLIDKFDKIESWSVDILCSLYNIDLSNVRETSQLVMF